MDFFGCDERVERVDSQSKAFADALAAKNDSRLRLPSLAPGASPRSEPVPAIDPSSFIALAPNDLNRWLNNPKVLIVDIRPNAAYVSARLPNAVSLSVPSTLLKRPLFSLDKLVSMLPSASSRARFSTWSSAQKILVYDADTHALPPTAILHGLLTKFRVAGFDRDLAWIVGGFQSVWKHNRDAVDASPPSPNDPDDDDDDDLTKDSRSSSVNININISNSNNTPAPLRAGHLPKSAFSAASTTVINSSGSTNPSRRTPRMSIPENQKAFNPFYDVVRQNTELSHGITEHITFRLPARVRKRVNDLPFSWLQLIAKRAAPSPHRRSSDRSPSDESDTDSDVHHADQADIDEGTEAFALQFYKIELAEQRRLMNIMEHHSRESGLTPASSQGQNPYMSSDFPYSITAGVEKGAKNRYKHIWPFEHARVKLHRPPPASGGDDYVNASFVQPICTQRRYIATQGPLPATFADFWELVWEQNVRVIVMLTREVENAMVKCGTYWTDGRYGQITLRCVSLSGEPASPPGDCGAGAGANPTAQGGFFVGTPDSPRGAKKKRAKAPVVRVFELAHDAFAAAGSRRVRHVQYSEWPDMNVPDDPRGVLDLIGVVEDAVEQGRREGEDGEQGEREIREDGLDGRTGVAGYVRPGAPPVLLHCSAGVGRTGGFIAIAAVLDAIRREMRAKPNDVFADSGSAESSGRSSRIESGDSSPMDVDLDDQPNRTRRGGGGDQTRSNRLVVPVPMRGSDAVVHVPFAGFDPLRTPMQVPSEYLDGRVANGASEEAEGEKATRRWAEGVVGGEEEQAPDGAEMPMQYSREDGFFESESSPQKLRTGNAWSKLSPSDLLRPAFQARNVSTTVTPGASVGDSPLDSSKTSPSRGSLLSRRAHGSSPLSLTDMRSAPGFHPSLPKPPGVGNVKSGLGASVLSGDRARENAPVVVSPVPMKGTPGPHSRSHFGSARSRSSGGSGPPPSDSASGSVGSGSGRRSIDGSERAQASVAPLPGSNTNSNSTKRAPRFANPAFVDDLKPAALAIDYKLPRALHGVGVEPESLSSFEEPMWEVIQDMREQRMSLCQSLRQYVFVHAAVLEGALRIVDEERERTKEEAKARSDTSRKGSEDSGRGWSSSESATDPPSSNDSLDVHSSPGKRRASPTELPKEDKRGDALPSKRPSVERAPASAEVLGAGLESAALPQDNNFELKSPPVPSRSGRRMR